MKHDIDIDKINDLLLKKNKEAKEILYDTEDTEETLNEIDEKTEKLKKSHSPLKFLISDIKTMTSLIKDFVSGKYKGIPYKSIIAITGGLIYFLSPIDLIPDVIPFAGLIDDTFVLTLLINQFKSDLEVYKAWKMSKEEVIEKWKAFGEKKEK